MLGCGKSVEEVNRHIVANLSPLYMIQRKSIISRPSIPRSEIDEIIRDAYANDRADKEMVSKELGVKGVANQHDFYAGGAQPAGGGGAGPGRERRDRRGGRFKGGQQQQQQCQQQP